MRALVVYESMFGNTEAVARAVADGLAEMHDVDLREVSQAPIAVIARVDLIVVGGPTHAFSLSRPATRGRFSVLDRQPARARHSDSPMVFGS